MITGNFKGKTPILGSELQPPLGSKLHWAPLTKNLDPPVEDDCMLSFSRKFHTGVSNTCASSLCVLQGAFSLVKWKHAVNGMFSHQKGHVQRVLEKKKSKDAGQDARVDAHEFGVAILPIPALDLEKIARRLFLYSNSAKAFLTCFSRVGVMHEGKRSVLYMAYIEDNEAGKYSCFDSKGHQATFDIQIKGRHSTRDVNMNTHTHVSDRVCEKRHLGKGYS